MTLEQIQQLIALGAYTVKSHAIGHMLEEGFELDHCLEAISTGTILEDYSDEKRCLMVGTFSWAPNTIDHLHVVVDYSDPDWLDLITAHIPRQPFWQNSYMRS